MAEAEPTEAGATATASSRNPFVLGFGTVIDTDFHQLVDAARSNGIPQITLNPSLYLDARAAGRSDGELRAELESSGVSVALVDPLISPLPNLPATDGLSEYLKRWFAVTEDDCFGIAEALGAPLITVVHPQGGFVEQSRMIDVIGGIAARAAERNLCIALEFSPTSLALGNLDTAMAIVNKIGASNVGIVFDTWHFYRSGGEVEDLASIPPAAIMNFQVNDAPPEAKGTKQPVLLTDRLLPGDGAIPLKSLIDAVLGNRPGLGITVEVFSARLRALPPREAAKAALEATRAVMVSG